MWKIFVYVLCHIHLANVYGSSFRDQMAEVTQICCDRGSLYARNHTVDDCTSAVPPDVPSALGSVCIFSMDECCKEYFRKQRDCDNGIIIAQELRNCASTSDTIAKCCNECIRGTNDGAAVCSSTRLNETATDEDMLSVNAYMKCCKAVSKQRKRESAGPTQVNSNLLTKKDALYSVCDDYAPTELCAHHCIPIPGSYKCVCDPGFKLMSDKKNCIEVVKNRCKPKNPCAHKCNDDGVHVKCSCRRGYELMDDKKSCKDINECALEPSICLPEAKCYNLQGSYKCVSEKNERGQCPTGYRRNISNGACDDINECELMHPPCPSYLCENTIGGYKCGGVSGNPANLPDPVNHNQVEDRICPEGFKAGADEECEDVDECEQRADDCNPLSQFCINTRGSFYCQDKGSTHCPPGFHRNPTSNKCEDIDECEDSQNVCPRHLTCVNTLGEYDCKRPVDSNIRCAEGMRMKLGSNYCEDIDECMEATHLCDSSQNCLNTNGSYECSCKLGFKLDSTMGTCVDINECASGQHSCLPDVQRCDNTAGSYLCIRILSCGTGYVLHHTTGMCEDIDECALGTHDCLQGGKDYQCINTPGTYLCEKQRKHTTTTTAAPVAIDDYYSEEYYDSEEEIESNKTSDASNNTTMTSTNTTSTITKSKTEVSSPTTTPNTTSMPQSQPPEETPVKIPEEPNPEENSIDNDIKPQTSSEPVPTLKPETEPPPSLETYTYISIDSPLPTQTEPSKEPERTTPKKSPDTFYETNIQQEINPHASIVPHQPDTSYNTIPNTDYESSSPTIVYLPDGQEIATEKPQEIDNTIKDNKYDSNSVSPRVPDIVSRECQPGFRMDNYGACFDVDECSTNTHSCSGLTELCRNTMGGYICDCAPGFRRDLSTGACDLIITTPTTPRLTKRPYPPPSLPPEIPILPSTVPTTSSTTTSTSTSTSTSTTASTTTSTTTTTTTLPPPPPPPPPPSTTPRHYFWGYQDHRYFTPRPFKPRTLCDAGFQLNSRTGRCEDINECTNGQANCAAVEICINTEGGYRCECLPNWRLDEIKQRCVPITGRGKFPPGYENSSPTLPPEPPLIIVGNSDNNNKEPSYEHDITSYEDLKPKINCPWGYRLGYGNTCEDVDECATGLASCGPEQQCVNQPGGYTCICPPGHKLVADHVCEDVNECASAGDRPICSRNADCINTVGSYKCVCHRGFITAPANDKVCVDIDECTDARPGTLCQHRCNNIWGSYRCTCHRGYRLNSDNRTCSDIDECEEYKSKMLCIGYCRNQLGSYRCTCPQGYRLSEDRKSCIDINECETGEAPCSDGTVYAGSRDICVNTRGGYKCQRVSCPPGYRLEDKHRCKKTDQFCPIGDWECAHRPSTYSYNFITFVSNLYIPNGKVDLFTMKGPKWPFAKMKFELRLVAVNAPPTVREKADFNAFSLVQNTNDQAMLSLTKPLQGPQSIELELSMELYDRDQFGGIAVAKLFIFVSEHEF